MKKLSILREWIDEEAIDIAGADIGQPRSLGSFHEYDRDISRQRYLPTEDARDVTL